MSLTEKIKEKVFEPYEWGARKAVWFDDVLAELDGYQFIPVGKWQEIVEHIKNRPKDIAHPHSAWERWFEVFEAKVAELEVKR